MRYLRYLYFFFLFAFALHAAPLGNPSSPRILWKGFFIPKKCWANVRTGYEGDFVFDGNMEQSQKGKGTVDRYTQMTNSGMATLNLLKRLDLYGVFGDSTISSQWRFSDMADRIRNSQMETSENFLWAIGGRAILLTLGDWDLGLGARYSASHSHLSWLTIDGDDVSLRGSHCDWRAWQVNLGFSYHICMFTPYVGAYYLNALMKVEGLAPAIADLGAHSDHLRNRYPGGLYLGCTISNGKIFMLNVEARVVAEEAASVTGEFRF